MSRHIEHHKTDGDPGRGLRIKVMDEPGPGGASHRYCIYAPWDEFNEELNASLVHEIHFQKGPIPENGINGLTHEVLLAIVIDRLEGFQAGPFACEQNAIALHHCVRALDALKYRTNERTERGVEGKLEP